MRSESKKKVTFKQSDQEVNEDKSDDKLKNLGKSTAPGKDLSEQSITPKKAISKEQKKGKQNQVQTDSSNLDKATRVELKQQIDNQSKTSKSVDKSQANIAALEKAISLQKEVKSLVSPEKANEAKSEQIKVAVRIRPFLRTEIAKENVCYVAKNNKQIRVSDLTHTVEGTYDRVFSKEASQSDVYQFVSDCIPNLLQGFNCTIFAYGQTGSGKTYTMFGTGPDKVQQNQSQIGSMLSLKGLSVEEYAKSNNRSSNGNTTNVSTDTSLFSSGQVSQKRGIIPRCIQELFSTIKNQQLKVTIYCSFLQIYNEKLFDLLQDSANKNPLQIREEKFQGIYVEGISEYIVQNESDCLVLLQRGERNRVKRATKMNMKSSRSHSIFQFLIETDQVDSKGMLKRSKLNLGDLAGSEKVNKDEEMQAKHMLELRNINLSLTTLGKVIQLLSQPSNSPSSHIPFRESKLTRLLQDSIGGNTSTYLVATVSPLMDSIEETISTLKFADRAKCVMQRVKKNEINAQDDALIQKLQREVQYLKELLAMRKRGNNNDMSLQLFILKDENERLRQMALNNEEIEKMKYENKQMRLELQKLRMTSEIGSSCNGDSSPKSLTNVIVNGNIAKSKKVPGSEVRQEESSDQDENNISKQFQSYQSQTDLVKNTKFEQKSTQPYSGYINQDSKLNSERKGNVSHRSNLNSSAVILEPHYRQKKEQITSLRQQKEKLQSVIQEQQQLRSLDNIQYKQTTLRKRNKAYRSESSDEAMPSDDQQLSLPVINESILNPYLKRDLTRKNSNQDFLNNNGSPYAMNRAINRSINPILRSQDNFNMSDAKKGSILKYPHNPRNIQNVRMSLGSLNDNNLPYQNQSINKDINRSYQLGSQGFIGLTTQSSLYGGNPSITSSGKVVDPVQTVVRIRGRHNQMIETKGSLMLTLDEEKKMNERRKQIRRSNERLKMLETMEQSRQEKMEQEIDRINQQKNKKEEEQQRKREALKQRKYVQDKTSAALIMQKGLS